MAEQDKPFVVNDRRKFRSDGELRDPQATPRTNEPASTEPAAEGGAKVFSIADAAPHHDQAHAADPVASERTRSTEPIPFNSAHSITAVPQPDENAAAAGNDEALPPPPTPEEIEQVQKAYDATAERLETVMRATNPGAEHLPPMDFTRLVQSIYMSAMVQLGAGTPQGEQARVDLLGAKQSIDMLAVIGSKTGTNLDEREQLIIDSALFELRMGFLEITQMLARQAAARQDAQGGPAGMPRPGAPFGVPGAGGPRIVS